MILDSLNNASRYASLHPKFAKAFTFLATVHTLNPGEYEIDGRSCYVIVVRGNAKTPHDVLLEAHRRYIDIHFLIEGNETIGWRPLHQCSAVNTDYDRDKDFMTFHDAPQSLLNLTPGDVAIFFPEDAHAPGMSNDTFFKAVVKLEL